MPLKADVKVAGDQVVVPGFDIVWAWIPGDELTITDDVGITDAKSEILAYARSITDNLGITDVASAVLAYIRTVSDNVGITDIVLTVRHIIITISNTVGITDVMTAVVGGIVAICKEIVGNSVLAILFVRKSRVNTAIDKESGEFDTDISKTSKIG